MRKHLQSASLIGTLAMLFGSPVARSIEPIAIAQLTSRNLDQLGFSLSITNEAHESTFVVLMGPRMGPNGCPPGGGGAGSNDGDAQLIGGFRYIQDAEHGRPASIAGVRSRDTQIGIYIDYVCPSGSNSETQRYILESLENHLKNTEID